MSGIVSRAGCNFNQYIYIMTRKQIARRSLERKLKKREQQFDKLWMKTVNDVNHYVEKHGTDDDLGQFKRSVESFVDSLCLSGAWIKDRLTGYRGVPGLEYITKDLSQRRYEKHLDTPTKTNIMKKQFICSFCGSPNIAFDAYAEWNPEIQKMELRTTFDNTTCDDCGGECGNFEVEYHPGQKYPIFFEVRKGGGITHIIKAYNRDEVEDHYKCEWGDVSTIDMNHPPELFTDLSKP